MVNATNLTAAQQTGNRNAAIDILRGIVMALMALDHVRDYFSQTPFNPLDLSQTNPMLFFTRWITHLCAPNFVFLSGVSIYLFQQKIVDKNKVSFFLLTRGLWLVAIEFVVISYLVFWNYSFFLLQVIWAIGISMVLMAALIRLPRIVLLIISIAFITLHQLIPDAVDVDQHNLIWALIHHTPFVFQGPPSLLVAYTILPWMGIMMLGYSVGHWFTQPLQEQKRTLFVAAGGFLLAFAILRGFNGYGNPFPWAVQDNFIFTLLSFLNVTKNPASLMYILLMVGIGLLILATVTGNKRLGFFKTLGSVPFFYYILHLTFIFIGAMIWTKVAFGTSVNVAIDDPATWAPAYRPNLFRAYIIWIILVIALYFPCRWFSMYKKSHPEKRWLSYL